AVTVGGSMTYSLTVTNGGPADATSAQLVDLVPASLGSVVATPSQGTCSGLQFVTCQLGTIASGGTATVQVVAKAGSPGAVVNQPVVSSSLIDGTSTNDQVQVTSAVSSVAG